MLNPIEFNMLGINLVTVGYTETSIYHKDKFDIEYDKSAHVYR